MIYSILNSSLVNQMVSTDVIVEASSTLIAGITFLVALRKAQKIQTTPVFIRLVGITLLLLVTAAAAAVGEDLIPASWGWQKIFTWLFFFGGLISLAASIVYSLK
jgi:hypothetical protein